MAHKETTFSSFDTRITNYKIEVEKPLTKDSYIDSNFESEVSSFFKSSDTSLLLCGDSLSVLKKLPSHSVDCAITSPPYWNKREYDNGGIGLEVHPTQYIKSLTLILFELKRVLKPQGSLWLNLGDSFSGKKLQGIPWRIAFELIDNQGWILRNSVIWNKLKSGMDNSKDRLGNVHENIFHFVLNDKKYFYNADAVRSKARESKVVNGTVVSATGVSGVRYRRQIELSTALSDIEKTRATTMLETVLNELKEGLISDFRMIIRGQHRTTHSDMGKVSGRARELLDKGFYFLKYHPNGSKPTDVWTILPEDKKSTHKHFAAYPIDLCIIPILATCPLDGVVLDPFCGTGTTLVAAKYLNRKSIGIDISEKYLLGSLDRLNE